MCDWKPGPRCFAHHAPVYQSAQQEYAAALESAFSTMNQDGSFTESAKSRLEAAYEDLYAKQQGFFSSPKARREQLDSTLLAAREQLEEDRKYYKQNPDEGNKILLNHSERRVEALQNQSVEGAHRWNQAKESSRFADELNENGLEQGLFSQAHYTHEKLAHVDVTQWDQASPNGEPILHGLDQKLQPSSDPHVHRELTITRQIRMETPTGERIYVDAQARIIQRKKGSSSYQIEYSLNEKGPNRGILIPNSATQDNYYAVGAVYERRPINRDFGNFATKGASLRAQDWDHYQKLHALSDTRLAHAKAQWAENQALIRAELANKNGLFSHHTAFGKVNQTPRGQRHNRLTAQWADKDTGYGALTSTHSIAAAKDDITRVLNQDGYLKDAVIRAREQSIKKYAAEQFGAPTAKSRIIVENQAKRALANLDKNDPAALRTRRQKRNAGGGADRATRNILRESRRAEQIKIAAEHTAQKERTRTRNLTTANRNMARLQKTHGVHTTVEPKRRYISNAGQNTGYQYTLLIKRTHGIHPQKQVNIEFDMKGNLKNGYGAYQDPRSGMVRIGKIGTKEHVATLTPDQYNLMRS